MQACSSQDGYWKLITHERVTPKHLRMGTSKNAMRQRDRRRRQGEKGECGKKVGTNKEVQKALLHIARAYLLGGLLLDLTSYSNPRVEKREFSLKAKIGTARAIYLN